MVFRSRPSDGRRRPSVHLDTSASCGSGGMSRASETCDRVEVRARPTDDALDFVHHAEPPWLLVASFNAPHMPRHEPPRRLISGRPPGEASDARYRAMLEAVDHEVGRLLRGVDRDTLNRTVVVLTSDNGTPEDAVVPLIG